MPIGMGVIPLVKAAVSRRIGYTFFAHALRMADVRYIASELMDSYAREWGASVKRVALGDLDVTDYPSSTEIIERPMLQRDKYHISGQVKYWDRDTGEVGSKWIHVYTDRVESVTGYNQMLIDAYQELDPIEDTDPTKLGKFVTGGVLDQIEHNEGWEY